MEEIKFKLNIEECNSIMDFVRKIMDEMPDKDILCKIADAITALNKAIKIVDRLNDANKADKEISLNYRQIVLILRAVFKWQKVLHLLENKSAEDWSGLIKELCSKIRDKKISDEQDLNSVIIDDDDRLREVAKENFWDGLCGLRTEEGIVKIFLPWRNDGDDSLLSLEINDFAHFLGTRIWFIKSLTQGSIEIDFSIGKSLDDF